MRTFFAVSISSPNSKNTLLHLRNLNTRKRIVNLDGQLFQTINSSNPVLIASEPIDRTANFTGDCNFISSFERIVSKSGLRSYVDEQRVVRKKCCISSRSAGLVGGRRRAVYPCKYHRSDIWDDLHLLYFPFFSSLFFFPPFLHTRKRVFEDRWSFDLPWWRRMIIRRDKK